MATPLVIDLAALLAPISDTAAAGDDIRADFTPQSVYFQLKGAQARARSDERKRREAYVDKPDTDFHPDDWTPVLSSCEEVLTGKSKDLEVAAWYLEALLRHHGFAGVRDGLRLIRELSEKFWDVLFPRPDEDGISTMVAPIAALNGVDGPGTLLWPISNIPITGVQPWGAWQYRQAQSLAGAADKDIAQRVQEGGVTPEMFRSAIDATPIQFFIDLLQDLEQAQSELQQLTVVFDERCGVDDSGYPLSPSMSALSEALAGALETVKTATAGLALEPEPTVPPSVTPGQPETPAVGGGPPAMSHPQATMSREQAFNTILQVAEFFKTTEPQSPVAYLLEKAVRWGRMPLPRLLRELIKGEPTLAELYRVMGVSDAKDDKT
jgi:type VI secretion system protein ImpA